ncbi:hypothetical protein CQP30_14105 [Yersinia pestis]|nr:hypothetical protein CEQ20_06070 [Yersinia pseudotuberculosis]AYW82563.1 hypothetical protein EGX42_06055 [Yersinia pestis]KNC63644.1 hypothetical protein M485_2753 [Yersinia pestis 14735]OSZ90771.1 hypothetical protein A7725_07355 [Yersinia pestis subsp. microtus bv. Caucasica]OUY12929.1 hypothetical protein BFI40_17070 [Yersinia pestis subsp. microtus bv. Altaica]OVY76691.1 hypothetical protein BFI50_08785 [Yersinia pestis subsp. microtus bv. Xilingolensis]OVY85551.1 hypothetical protein
MFDKFDTSLCSDTQNDAHCKVAAPPPSQLISAIRVVSTVHTTAMSDKTGTLATITRLVGSRDAYGLMIATIQTPQCQRSLDHR